MLPVGSVTSSATSVIGLMAVSIAVFGFLGQTPPVLAQKDEGAVRVATVVGGLVGFVIAVATVIVDSVW